MMTANTVMVATTPMAKAIVGSVVDVVIKEAEDVIIKEEESGLDELLR